MMKEIYKDKEIRKIAYLLFIYNKTDKRNQRFQDFSQNSRIYKTQLPFVNVFFGHPLIIWTHLQKSQIEIHMSPITQTQDHSNIQKTKKKAKIYMLYRTRIVEKETKNH